VPEPIDLPDLRAALRAEGLNRDHLKPAPLEQLQEWLAYAQSVGLHNADAMAVATASADGLPAVRNVLWRGVIGDGLVFYSDYQSRKGVDLIANPRVEALFSWLAIERQVRLTGSVRRLTDAQSDAYFAKRPRGSQLAALTSDQSQVVPDREWLERRYNALEAAHDGREIPRPESWGGYLIQPIRYEFWQGREHRLHDRLVYELGEDGWEVIRLAP
jgi:pyridoxamine 5'-phosphate oxidase